MIACDAIVVGGGPAGSSCARALAAAGWRIVVLDRARFPRDKVCAGWLTPDVFPLLDLTAAAYRQAGLTLQEITGFRTRVIGRPPVDTRYPRTISYAIRRCEFDAFLLRRAGARVLEGTAVSAIRRTPRGWSVNGLVEAPVLVGAGGHFCPVARHLRGGPEAALPVVAKEAEFRLGSGPADVRPDVPELLFCRDLQGYGWCVRKGEYVNVGLGRRDNRHFNEHVRAFCEVLASTTKVRTPPGVQWRGHAYLAAGVGPRPVSGDGIVLVGDAAGLAYPESGEGIRPAIASGLLAGEVLARTNGRFTCEALLAYARTLRQLHPPRRQSWPATDHMTAALGRLLMRSATFTRHVVLDRWFLRSHPLRG